MKTVVIIGAGPAGLTAAWELLKNDNYRVVVLEALDTVGGISRTVIYKGNRMDIGGHRFFSKSDWVMDWWANILPILADEKTIQISYQNKRRTIDVDALSKDDARIKEKKIMLVRNRLSRIFYLRKYFDYPLKLNLDTIKNLGLKRVFLIIYSYALSQIKPVKPEKTLQDFFINRFGYELYRTFFKDYTEKVWGVPCDSISAEWGAQRIKGLSIKEALVHAIAKSFSKETKAKKTSLIEKFLYPYYGPGQLWEEVSKQIMAKGGEIYFNCRVTNLKCDNYKIKSVIFLKQGVRQEIECDYVISTMPVKDLVLGMTPKAPDEIEKIAANLPYRDFITVGLLLSRMKPNKQSKTKTKNNMPADNWIYVQEPDVKLGRIQIFNNWSPGLVKDPSNIWLGLEYFCQEGDNLWKKTDQEMIEFALTELEKIGMIDRKDFLDGTVVRVPKTYPAYFGDYQRFHIVRSWLDQYENLFLIGRNGMHRYNNQDHSMLTARYAVEAIISGSKDKSKIWEVNIDDEYHEEKS